MKKLSKSECGKLGIAKSQATIKELRLQKQNEYYENPNHCKFCNQIIDYLKRRQIFCGHSCSASYNNKNKIQKSIWTCIGCNKVNLTARGKTRKYCDNRCQQIETKNNSYEKLKNGEITNRFTIKNILVRYFGHRCSSCNLSEWLGVPIPLEVDHINGDASNNVISNLRLLCPNCHGITPTWKGRNRGFGRRSRGLPLN
jgi:5-methylcytosine-specific restriction endonuclease McrA